MSGSNADITPAVTITSSSLDHPDFGVFDNQGNLWVSNYANSEIVEFTAAQLGSSGTKTPNIILSSNGDSLSGPNQMAFDTKGNLWVANYNGETVAMFAKKELKASGSPTPKVTLSSSALDGPWGLTFDSAHNLWVSNFGNGDILKFSSKQYKKTGSPTPSVTLTGVLSEGSQMIFSPSF